MEMNESKEKEKLGIRLTLKSLSVLIVFVLITFLVAGRLDYWQGWVFNGVNIFFIALTFVVLRDRVDLIKERLKPGERAKPWDRIYYIVSTPLFFVMFILSIVDAARFAWRPTVPFLVVILGIVLYSLGQIILLWAKHTNRFFSSVVRIQQDRNQTVCTEGPYRFVRHPGYLGGIIFTLATPLMLGSYWGMIPATLTIIVVFVRTYLEDTTLQKELPGYRDYTQKVRYKIIPFVW